MSRSFCLTRQCLGLETRIECQIRSLHSGLWTLLCAAGIADTQPTAVRVQGPFRSLHKAEDVLSTISAILKSKATMSPIVR